MSGVHRESVAVAGKNIVFEVGRLAPQASGACLVRLSDTVVLVTAVAESEPRRGIGFFPLTVEYRDRFAAAGRIPPTRIRRELRPSDTEILSSRVIDRTIRPLFPEGFRSEVQVIATVLSAEPETDPALLSLLGASAALHVSDIPWAGPVAGARFCLRGGGLVAFPEESERAGSELDLVAAIGPHGLVMVEGGAAELPEAEVVDALLGASTVLRPLIAAQERLREAVGREKRTFSLGTPPADVARAVAAYRSDLEAALTVPGKRERHQRVDAVRNDAVAAVEASLPDAPPGAAADAFGALKHELSRRLILDGRRADGRAFDEVRPIGGEAGLLPRTHGSALFTRGETQALASVTLGTGSDALAETTLFGEEKRRFFLHYNFPPYSVGETRPLRGPGRREIGHGTLAQRAIEGLLPDDETFPYTVRIVSDILASNGSSSMATVCAGCLALLDAGVPIRRPVAGIAMGLVREGDEVAVLTDILGDEDHVGDMDFKVCGTAEGVTALQMDIKMEALDEALLSRAMERARQGRLHILGEMEKTLAAPRADLSPHAPRLLSRRVRPERIREIIGAGGRTIRGIVAETGASVDVDDEGLVRIAASDRAAARAALAKIDDIVREAEVGAVYAGIAKFVKDMVAFVEIFPGTEGSLHISEVAPERIGRVADVVRAGDTVVVRVLGVDDRGRIQLSRKAALGADPTEIRSHHAEAVLP